MSEMFWLDSLKQTQAQRRGSYDAAKYAHDMRADCLTPLEAVFPGQRGRAWEPTCVSAVPKKLDLSKTWHGSVRLHCTKTETHRRCKCAPGSSSVVDEA